MASSPSPRAGRWLAGHFNVCLAVYDARRGAAEGREMDKLLGFYPPTAPPSMQCGVCGLAQAATVFAGTFNGAARAFRMETDHNLWAALNAEPGVWLLFVAGRAWAGAAASTAALEDFLRCAHALAALLHGPVNALLEDDPSGGLARRRLQPLLEELAAQLLQRGGGGGFGGGGDGGVGGAARIACPLAMRGAGAGAAPLMRVSRPAFAALQALLNRQLAGCGGGGGDGAAGGGAAGTRLVHGAMACFGHHLLWSTLAPGDTAALFELAARGILPAVRAGPKHRPLRRPLRAGAAATGAAAAAAGSGGAGGAEPFAPHQLLSSSCWELLPSGIVQPVGGGGGGGAGDSGGSANAAGGEQSVALPLLFLQGGRERARLLAHHCGPLTVLLLLRDAPPPALAAAAAAAARQLSERGPPLAARLAAEVPAKHAWHVPGLRYYLSDGLAGAERASPLPKVATLSLASLLAAGDARAAVELEAAAAAEPRAAPAGRGGGGGGSAVGSPTAAAGSAAQQHHRHHHDHDHHHCGHAHAHGHHHHHHHHRRPRRRAADPEEWAAWLAGRQAGDFELVLRAGHECSVVARRCGASPGAGCVGCGGGGGAGSGAAAAAAGGGGDCSVGAAAGGTTPGGADGDGDGGDACLLLAVLEGERDRAGLPSAMGQVDALCDAICPGVFDGVA